MKVIITGSTGMVGKGVLLECIDSPMVTDILVVNRSTTQFSHPKVKAILCPDWFDLTSIKEALKGYDACFFCLGVTAANLSEAQYHKITYLLTLNFAETLVGLNPEMTFCYVSGMGVSSDQESRTMWKRIKAQTEQALLKLPFKHCYMFRPGYIQALRGVRSKTVLYRIFYILFSPFYPLIKRFFPHAVTSTVKVGQAMISVAKNGYKTPYLENDDINA